MQDDVERAAPRVREALVREESHAAAATSAATTSTSKQSSSCCSESSPSCLLTSSYGERIGVAASNAASAGDSNAASVYLTGTGWLMAS